MSIVLWLSTTATADETHTRYFEQLRQRGLFSLAEGEALSRLTTQGLSLAARTSFSIELSRTFTEHAGFVSDEQREELWERARTIIQELLDRDRLNPRSVLLEGQLASVSVSEGDWQRAERALRPFDDQLLNRAKTACTHAIERLQAIEKRLTEPARDAGSKRPPADGPTGYELRSLLHQVRFQLGQTFCNLAELAPVASPERAAHAASAEQSLRKLTGVADEPLQTRARILLVACMRLKGEPERAFEALNAMEKSDLKPIDSVLDELTAERARVLMELEQYPEAAELLMKTRSKRQRLTGELWFLQTRTLIALRDITRAKQQETLSERLGDQILTTIQRSEEQVGGFWARRCRQLWDNSQTAQKYGPELDALMQQARSSFTAGRIDTALSEYASAEAAARKNDQSDLAMELGFTRASILLDQKRNEDAAAEFLRLSTEYPTHKRAASAHLLGAYALGRFYDEKKSQPRREAYTEALDQHLKTYPQDPTVNEARFLKAQLEEQRFQATQALPLYLDVEPGHTRASEAISGAARCYETILRRMIERRLPTRDFESEAIGTLTKFLSRSGKSIDSWTDTHAEVALRLISILLMDPSEDVTRTDTTPPQEGGLKKGITPRPSTRLAQASQWLDQVMAYQDKRRADADSINAVTSLQQRIDPLRVIILSRTGKSDEADRLLKSLIASPAVLLFVMEGLSRFASTAEPNERARTAWLQLKAAEQLLPQKEKLSPGQRIQLDRSLAAAYLATGQANKGVETMKRLASASLKDVEVQRAIAVQLSDTNDNDGFSLAQQCWRRVESLSPPGSPEWMTARLGALRATVKLKQTEEARKLLQVTKILYPDLGGEPFAGQFEALERDLPSRK